MNIFINGQQMPFAAGITIAQILDTLQIVPASIVVELNEDIIPPEGHHNSLFENDRLEFIRFVGGG